MATAEIEGPPAPSQRWTRLTPRQLEVFGWIRAFVARKGYGPSVREIMAGMHIVSPNGVVQHLKALERKGVIRRDFNTSRSIVVVEDEGGPDDRALLREALRMVLDNGKPVPSAEPGEGDIGLSVYLGREDWDHLKALAGEGGS